MIFGYANIYIPPSVYRVGENMNNNHVGYMHNYGGTQKGYFCTQFFSIEVGMSEPLSMAIEMHDAERGIVNRQPFGIGMMCNGRIGNWMERNKKTGRFIGKTKEIEIWKVK